MLGGVGDAAGHDGPALVAAPRGLDVQHEVVRPAVLTLHMQRVGAVPTDGGVGQGALVAGVVDHALITVMPGSEGLA